MQKDKKVNNDVQTLHRTLKFEQHKKLAVKSGVPKGQAVPTPHVISVVLLFLQFLQTR
jgi:hypothetical protein